MERLVNTNQLPPLSLDHGACVIYRGKRHVIRQESRDFTTVVLFEPESGTLIEAPIVDLYPAAPLAPSPQKDLNAHDDERLAEAERKFTIIKPLLDKPGRTKQEVMARAAGFELHYVTLYSWLRTFEIQGRLSAFVRRDRKDKGKNLLPAATERIVSDSIEALYLSRQKIKPSKVIEEVQNRCAKAGLDAPHPNTVRSRIKQIDAFKRVKAREGNKAARDQYAPSKGQFPGADFPLSVVQIDHTPMDIILVDDIHRQPIGRPWLTLLIDVYSRMVLGFYISFDPPGNLSLGLCLAHAFLPKEKWLAKLGIETAWPCWGVPRTIHADNAKEFRGNMLQKACKEYGIDLEWRPVATPHYGAHIERLLGTLNGEIHAAPGTTFANPQERGEYDSEGQAAMSLAEFEKWFSILCVEAYHQKPHSELGMPPVAKWQEGILGSGKKPGLGVPPRITDERRLKLDLMPYETRTVQQYGIVWDHIGYQHDLLRRWINAPDPENPRLKRKFLCRRDPRDISVIWFYDPEVHQYYAIPYRNTSHPAISIWELRETERRLTEERPDIPVDENLIFDAYDKMRRIEEEAKRLTKKVRRGNERRRLGLANARAHIGDSVTHADEPVPPPPSSVRSILPFDEVDDMQNGRDG
jgi:putative transposase